MMWRGSEKIPRMPAGRTRTPVSSSVSRTAQALGDSPSSIWPIGSAHCPVSRRRWRSRRLSSSRARTPHAGTSEFGTGACGSSQYSVLLPMRASRLASWPSHNGRPGMELAADLGAEVADGAGHGDPLLLAGGPAGDLDQAVGQVAAADREAERDAGQLGVLELDPGPLLPVV